MLCISHIESGSYSSMLYLILPFAAIGRDYKMYLISSTTKCACAPYSTDPKNNFLYENASWIINALAIHTIT